PRVPAGGGVSLAGDGPLAAVEVEAFVHPPSPETPRATPAPARRLRKRRRSASNSRSVMRRGCWLSRSLIMFRAARGDWTCAARVKDAERPVAVAFAGLRLSVASANDTVVERY